MEELGCAVGHVHGARGAITAKVAGAGAALAATASYLRGFTCLVAAVIVVALTSRFWAPALRVAEFVLASTLCCLRSPRFGSVLLIGVPLVSAARTPMQQTGDGGGNGLSIVVAVGAAASALAALRAAFAAKELEKKRVDREYDELKVRMFLPHDADDPLVHPSLSMHQRRTTTCRPTNKRR